MKVYVATILMTISSFSYAVNIGHMPLGVSSITEQSIKETIKKVTTLPPVENVNITVFANTIAGPVKKLTTNSCIKAVEFLRPSIGEKPMVIMDGGYSVEIERNERKFHLSSQQEALFAWIEHCEKSNKVF